MEYLVNDRNDFFDKKFISRLEHQTMMLKRLINLQAAQAIAATQEQHRRKGGSASPNMIEKYQKAVQTYTQKIDNIQEKLRKMVDKNGEAVGSPRSNREKRLQ